LKKLVKLEDKGKYVKYLVQKQRSSHKEYTYPRADHQKQRSSHKEYTYPSTENSKVVTTAKYTYEWF
jgi:hypothetical protein